MATLFLTDPFIRSLRPLSDKEAEYRDRTDVFSLADARKRAREALYEVAVGKEPAAEKHDALLRRAARNTGRSGKERNVGLDRCSHYGYGCSHCENNRLESRD